MTYPALLRVLTIAFGGLLLLGMRTAAAPPASDAVFTQQVEPILARHCASCHANGKKKGGLEIGSLAQLLAGGPSGPLLVPGKASESLVVHVLSPKGQPHMPPKGQLTSDEIGTLKKWIDGLKPSNVTAGKVITDQDRAHWAFRPLAAVQPPPSSAPWVQSPIDAFILTQLHAAKLKPAPEATRLELIRRAWFDLIGLPPTPAEVEALLADRSPDWYEKMIDQLLASPHYGARWGRHWLDLARYAESNGIGEDKDRPNAWRYRDYVIDSFNADKPYGLFIREQLAGDEIDPTNPAALVATGFCRHAPTVDVIRAQDTEKYRIEELDDVITTTASVFMGLTLGCARCHDHKYDPVTQADYYRFLAVFNSTKKLDIPLAKDATAPAEPPMVAGGVKTVKQDAAKLPSLMTIGDIGASPRKTTMLWRGDVRNPGPEVQPGVPEVLTRQPLTFPKPAAGVKSTGRRKEFADWLADPANGLTWRVMANRVWQYHFGRGIVDSSSNFGVNGDRPTHPELLEWLASILVANEGRLKPLHKAIMMSSTYRQAARHDEAAAKLDPDNRLLWRMSRRRLEAEPIRDSMLAVSGRLNLAMGGPSIRPRIHPNLLAGNQMTRWPTVAKEGPEHWKRSIYIYVKRSLGMPMMDLFDAPTPTQSCSKRTESTVPTQALLLMNGEFLNEQAAYFAQRVQQHAGADVTQQVDRAVWLALSRPADPAERAQLAAFVRQQAEKHQTGKRTAAEASQLALTDLCHVLLSCNEFVYVN